MYKVAGSETLVGCSKICICLSKLGIATCRAKSLRHHAGDCGTPFRKQFPPAGSLAYRNQPTLVIQNMNKLGRFIVSERKRKALTQEQLAQKAAIDQGNLSKIESGQNLSPTVETLQKLADVLNTPFEKFRDLAVQSRPRDKAMAASRSQSLRVGVAHTTWAAPVLALAYSELPPGVTLYSFASFDKRLNAWEPYGYESSQEQHEVKGGPSIVRNTREDLPGVDGWGEEEKFLTYTADELLGLLFDEDKFDCILLAGEVYQKYSRRLLRCAQIMSAVTGCSITICAHTKWLKKHNLACSTSKEKTPVDFRQAWNVVAEYSRTTPVRALYGRNTIAQSYVNQLPAHIDPQWVQLGNWERFWSFFMQEVMRCADTDNAVFLLIGWEPHISWIKRATKVLNDNRTAQRTSQKEQFNYEATLKDYDFVSGYFHDMSLEDRPSSLPKLTFDLVFPLNAALDQWVSNKVVYDFLNRVGRIADSLSDESGPDRAVVKPIAHYLDMLPPDCEEHLKQLNPGFAVKFYPEWVDRLREQPFST